MKMMTHTTAMMTVLLRYSQTLTQIQMTLCTTAILRVTVPLDWSHSVSILTLHDLLYNNDDSFIMIQSDSNTDTDDTVHYSDTTSDSAIGLESFCINPYFA